jgi:uncharacterized protein (TIGR02284 family)
MARQSTIPKEVPVRPIPGGIHLAPVDGILAACADAERRYRAAALRVNDARCALMFSHYADERGRFVGELRHSLHRAGTTQTGGSNAGALRCTCIDARAKLTHGRAWGLVAECARGEEPTLLAYHDALRADLSPPGLRQLAQDQYEAVKRAHAELTALLDDAAD